MGDGVGTAELDQRNLVNVQSEGVPLPAIDVEQFEAVPEHGGNLQTLIDRYGENPGSCPYLKGMGEAGIQLVQRLAESAKDPDRGPTIRELLEARKEETQVKKDDPVPSRPHLDAYAAQANETKYKSDEKPIETRSQTLNRPLPHEQPVRAVPEAVKAESINTLALDINPSTSPKLVAKKESAVEKQVKVMTEDSATITEQAPLTTEATIDLAIAVAPASETDVQTITELEDVLLPESSPLILEVPSEEFNFENPSIEISESVELTFPETNVCLTEAYAEAVNQDIELDKEVFLDMPGSDALLPEASATLVQQTLELPDELNGYIESLGTNEDEVKEIVLQTLSEVIKITQEAKVSGDEFSEADEIRIEILLVELLETLNIEFQEETVKALVQQLPTVEVVSEKQNQGLSIDRRNRLGTHEYKQVSIALLLTNLAQMVKQNLESRLRLARYILSATFA
ncbi:MAG TPA: hypothetical protein VL989_02015 [Candidatus Sulfotelmatobacter sp.]|nr:hypothetical protein [Candidatus Sulfotelmatobacter sp.]